MQEEQEERKYEDNYKDQVDDNNDGNGCDQCALITNGGIMDMFQQSFGKFKLCSIKYDKLHKAWPNTALLFRS